MNEHGVLVTGAGGFLGRFILNRYLNDYPHELFLLECGPFLNRLRAYLEQQHPEAMADGRVHLFEGDITQPGLAVEAPMREQLAERVTAAIHLAAVYHLAVPRDVAMRVNVDGTKNTLDFVQTLPRLERFAHVSTLGVAGRYEGIFDEKDFDKGQDFNNYYEETKFLAEKLVRERMPELAAVIFRPAVVVGHSKTGYIEKVDGPYYLFTTLARNIHWIMPDCGPVKSHIAPVDFVTDGIVEIFEKDPDAIGNVCALMDPDPITHNTFLELVCEAWPKSKPILRVPWRWLRPLAGFSLFETITGVPWQVFQYGNQRIEYTLPDSTRRLAALGIRCPSPPEYIQALVRFYICHMCNAELQRGDWRARLELE